MLMHTPTHNFSLPYIVIYFLCTGSYFISFKLRSKFSRVKTQREFSFYEVNLLTNIAVIGIVMFVQPTLLFHLFGNLNFSLFLGTILIVSFFLGMLYVDFEAWLYRAPQLIYPIQKTSPEMTAMIITIAVLEEILFRGIVVTISLSIGGTVAYLLIVFGTVMFGLSHLFAGWLQFYSKLIFSAFMTLLFLFSGNILAPIIAHMVFNYRVLQRFPLKGEAV